MNILVSFAYFAGDGWEKMLFSRIVPKPVIFGDSGAFSAWSLGKIVDIGAYADWLYLYRDWFAFYANLDVVGEPKKGMKNLAYLEGRGLHPIPVYHAGEPWRYLEEMAKSYPVVGLGGIARAFGSLKARGKGEAWLGKCFDIAGDVTVFHGFGLSSIRSILDYPWFSVDSTSWAASSMYGQLNIFIPQRRKMVHVRLGDSAGAYRYARWIRHYGYEPEEFANRKKNVRDHVHGLSAKSFVAAQDFARERRGLIPARGSDHKGLILYLAQVTLKDVRGLAREMGLWVEDLEGDPEDGTEPNPNKD